MEINSFKSKLVEVLKRKLPYTFYYTGSQIEDNIICDNWKTFIESHNIYPHKRSALKSHQMMKPLIEYMSGMAPNAETRSDIISQTINLIIMYYKHEYIAKFECY